MTAPVVPQSPDTKTFFQAVLEFYEEKGVKFSKDWKQVHLNTTDPDYLVPMFGYNIGYTIMGGCDTCSVYSFRVFSKEESLEEGCLELTGIILKDGCTVYSALYLMLFDYLTWTPVVRRDGKDGCESINVYECEDWDWENLNEFLCEKFPGISENFAAPGFDS